MADLKLHVGYPRTGTTAMQEALASSSRRLGEQGVHVPPMVGTRHRHLMLFDAFRASSRHMKVVEAAFPDGRADNAEEWLERVAETARGYESVIMSEEGLASLATDEVSVLKARLFARFDNIEVFITFRPHRSFLMSAYSQQIYASFSAGTFLRFVENQLGTRLLNYCGVLDGFIDAFGRQNVRGFFYDYGENGSSNASLLTAMGAASAVENTGQTPSNTSLSRDAVELRRQINPIIGKLVEQYGVPPGRHPRGLLGGELDEVVSLCRIRLPDELWHIPDEIGAAFDEDWEQLCSDRYASVFKDPPNSSVSRPCGPD